DDPLRLTILGEAAESECRTILERAWRREQTPVDSAAVAAGLEYRPRHPLEKWALDTLAANPALTWDQLWAASAEPRREASVWLFRTRNQRAQDTRLRTRIERDAFLQMTPAWQRLGFPFRRLVPSLATAIGSS